MRRHLRLIKQLDAQNATPPEIVKALGFDPTQWHQVWAVARIYVEDGGKRYTIEQFVDACQEANQGEGAEMRPHLGEFVNWKP